MYTGSLEPDVEENVRIMNELIKDEDVFGISVSVLDTEAYAPVINRGVELGKAIITFDSDAPDSDRLAYVGTDNYEMGRGKKDQLKESDDLCCFRLTGLFLHLNKTELAKLLKQIKLDGGNVASSLDLDTISRNVFGVLKKDWRKMVAFGLKSKTRPRTDTRIQLSACKSCGRSHKSTQTPWVTLGGIVSVVGLVSYVQHWHWIYHFPTCPLSQLLFLTFSGSPCLMSILPIG